MEINKLQERIVELENLNSYSTTDEKVIGTWVNGDKLYIKTFIGDETDITANTLAFMSVPGVESCNIKECIDVSGLFRVNDSTHGLMYRALGVSYNYYGNGLSDLAVVTVQPSLNRIGINYLSHTNQKVTPIITIKYTKTPTSTGN